MRKTYHYFLFFTFIMVSSLFAAEEITTPAITVKTSTSKMSQVIRILEDSEVKLDETIFCFDFDETLATTVATYEDHEFRFLSCPDRIRTYKQAFSAAFQNSKHDLNSFDFMSLPSKKHGSQLAYETYEILDPDVVDLIHKLKEESFFVGVCSSLSGNEDKFDFMERLGLTRDKFIFGGGSKAQAICGYLKEIMKPGILISTIVLIDNSEEFAIKPFLKSMPNLIRELGIYNFKVIGIEFTMFSERVTKKAIAEELTLLETLLK